MNLRKINNWVSNGIISRMLGVGFLILFYLVLYKLYIPHITAFGCFDDCFNFMGGYFLLSGKHLYSQIFFNHAPFMAYLSAIVQYLTHPINLFDLVLRHRQFLFGFSFVMSVGLFIRFGWRAPLFTLFFELTKFYLFGDRFLAEAYIVYPLVYLAGVVWESMHGEKSMPVDIVVSPIATWFVVFMREPYIPVALVLYGIILWKSNTNKQRIISFVLFAVLSVATLLYHDMQAFYFNVISVNSATILSQGSDSTQMSGVGFLKAVLYPFLILVEGKWDFLRFLLFGIGSIFIAESLLLWKRYWKQVSVIWILLGLANLRSTTPGMEFYEAFHMIVWYGLLFFFSFLFLEKIVQKYPRIKFVFFATYLGLFLYSILPPGPFFYSKIVEHDEFITNYGYDLQIGNIVSDLSSPKDTLFLDGAEDSIYWVAHRYSPYEYSWYTSVMPKFGIYTTARHHMLVTTPPDFYFGSCKMIPNPDSWSLAFIKSHYEVLYSNDKPSCLWVKKEKISKITDAQWQKAKGELYYLP